MKDLALHKKYLRVFLSIAADGLKKVLF